MPISKTQAIIICAVVCTLKIIIVFLLARTFMKSNGTNKDLLSQLDKNGYCKYRNSPLAIPAFTQWNLNITEPIEFSYQDAKFPPVIINGNKLEFKIDDKSKINYAVSMYQQEFKLDRIFIVSPSLHTIASKSYDLEMQLSFKLDNSLANKLTVNLLMDFNNNINDNHQNSLFFKPIMNAIKNNKNIFVPNKNDTLTINNDKQEIVRKADESRTKFSQYFTYLGSTALPPCTGKTEVPQIVIDLNSHSQIFMNDKDMNTIKTFLNGLNEKAVKADKEKKTHQPQMFTDLEDRVLLPMDGALNINYDNKHTFVDKRSFWRSILLNNDGTKTQIELQLESYALQKQVVNEIMNANKYVKHQLEQHGHPNCVSTSVRELTGDIASKEGIKTKKDKDTDNKNKDNIDLTHCNELRDLLNRQWEEKRNDLVCNIRPRDCRKKSDEVEVNNLNVKNLNNAFNNVDRNKRLIQWLLQWFGNIAQRNIDGNDAWNKYANNAEKKNHKIHLVKYDAKTQRYYYDGFVETNNIDHKNEEVVLTPKHLEQLYNADKNIQS